MLNVYGCFCVGFIMFGGCFGGNGGNRMFVFFLMDFIIFLIFFMMKDDLFVILNVVDFVFFENFVLCVCGRF